MTIHHIIHFDTEHQDWINNQLNLIIQKLDKIMANEEQFKAALARVETATTAGGVAATAIQARINALIEAIKNAGLSKEQEDALLAQTEGLAGNVESLATALTEMGKDPVDPVPDPIPDPIPEARRR